MMRHLGKLILFIVPFLLTACGEAQNNAEVADAIYENANIWTGVDGVSASAIAIKDGKIIAIGSADDVAEYGGDGTRTEDLAGKMMVPGFIDNHVHFLSGGFSLANVDLRDADTPEEFAKRLGAFAKTLPKGKWIVGGNWDHERWGGELPKRDWIDALTPDNPVLVDRLDGHMALANTLAMDLAGIDDSTPDPEGGVIERDENGRAEGVLKDRAFEIVEAVIPESSHEELEAVIQLASANALKNGVTQIIDMGNWESLETYRRLHGKGELNLRIYSVVPLDQWAELDAYIKANGRGDDMLWWGGLKALVDGSLGSTTAWFYDVYEDEPDTAGLVITDLDAIAANALAADKLGLHLNIHAIGDRANDWLLDMFENLAAENGVRERRSKIEHAQHLSRGAIARFAELGVIPSMQPYHAIDDGRWAEKRIGAERIKTTYAFRSLLDAGAELSFGSDWTVAPISPVLGIYGAVTRRTLDDANPDGWVPEEKITVTEALKAYTSTNAYASFGEDKFGTLEVGKYADFVVLSEDLFAIAPEDIEDVMVLRTVIAGEDKFVANQ